MLSDMRVRGDFMGLEAIVSMIIISDTLLFHVSCEYGEIMKEATTRGLASVKGTVQYGHHRN